MKIDLDTIYGKNVINLATKRGFDPFKHILALKNADIDQASLTHPYNFLTEEEVELVSFNFEDARPF